jgi:hypothetical protein
MKSLISFIFFIISLNCFCQEVKPFEELKLTDSTLIKEKSDILVLKQNKKFQVITSRKQFISTCKAWSSGRIDSFIKLLNLIDKNKSKEINANELKNKNLESAFEQVFEDLLLDNKCIVYNRGRRKLEKIVYVILYDPNDDNYGMEYKTENNLLILKTVKYMGI